MKNIFFAILLCFTTILFSCSKKTPKDRAIELVKSQYNSSNQKLDFKNASLDSLYNISPQAYANHVKRGNELDSILAVLESQVEHLSQHESDSVGVISAKLTQERYQLLETAKIKPRFMGWKLSGIKTNLAKSEILSFKFNEGITEIVP